MKFKVRRKSHKLRSQSANSEVHNGWEISYGDMITLLLGFFVLFFNIKTDHVNMKLLVEKLEKKFNKATGESVQTGFQQKRESTKNLLSSPSLQKYKLHSNMVGDKLMIEFPGVSFFAPGSVELTHDGKHVLKEFASSIDKAIGSVRLVVRGYTDNSQTVSKKFKDNLELSAFRSLSAIRHLNSSGIDLKYMRVGGYGEANLSDRRLSPEERKVDRKIVIVVEPLDAVERNHESLNKVADQEEEKKKREIARIKDRQKLKENEYELAALELIQSETIFDWLSKSYSINADEIKNRSISSATNRVAANIHRPQESKSNLIKKILRVPASLKHYKVEIAPTLEKQDQTAVDHKMIKWVESTYLYKRVNPYYFEKKNQEIQRGEK